MRLAISNIAWDPAEDDAVAALMRAHGCAGVEIAPTKYWPRPLQATGAELSAVRAAWERRGFPVVSLQSLLFGGEGLALFETPARRAALRDYLLGIFRVAAALGAGPLVFGSPKNRLRGALSDAEADAIAVPFFRELAGHAEAAGVCLCLEPNPTAYGCDWITDSRRGRAFVDAVNRPGFALHLDAAGMTLANEALSEAIAAAGEIRHFHASAPQLAPVGGLADSDHARAGVALRTRGYPGFVSIEMRPPESTGRLAAIDRALAHAAGCYAG